MANVWYIKGDFRIIPKPNNVFLIGFELEEDKKKVLKGSPWLVSNMHFCLKGWFPDMILSQVSFRQVMFWVQLHDIPTGLLRHDKIARIGSVFAVFHHYEPSLEAMLGWQGFIRARVEIEIEKPLLPGVACLDSTGNEIWVKFQYERLGELCNRSGLITHPTNRCLKLPRHDEGIERPAEKSFGPWMRAKEILGKHYPAKKQTPLEQEEEQGTEPQVKGKEILRFDDERGEADGNSIAPNKKRKTVEADVQPPIQNAACKDHTGIMNTVAELVSELHDASPIQASASKPSWKRMARKAWPFRLVFFLYQINAMCFVEDGRSPELAGLLCSLLEILKVHSTKVVTLPRRFPPTYGNHAHGTNKSRSWVSSFHPPTLTWKRVDG
ncbi:hypothetical protein Tsubulata_000319 [Turnera subulata]|uniref:DUF4283 domain-containing protein n=1 Tax=Turnera subulata TaxID=218843 RepID=A0A9Q0J085_9ROSI|nr:hypothetical protein Tsubulata_000319 [Turnera subulata]